MPGPATPAPTSAGRRAVRRLLTASPLLTQAVAGAAAWLGADRPAERLLRLALQGDVASAYLPATGRWTTRTRLEMYRLGGGDQCAAALDRAGWGGFEPPMPTVFLAECRARRGTVLDVGANTGLYALIAARAGNRDPVAAFEPLPYVADLLAANLRRNGVDDLVTVHRAAVAAEPGEATLYVPVATGPGVVETSASLSVDFKQSVATKEVVAVTTLDSWWVTAGRPGVSVIKVDVESRELDVLLGAQELIRAQSPTIFYELLPQGDAVGLATFAAAHDLVDVRLREHEAVIGSEPVFDPAAWNHMFVPARRIGEVRGRMERLGLT